MAFALKLLVLLAVVVGALAAFKLGSAIPFAVVAALAILGVRATKGAVQSLAIGIATLGVILCALEVVALVIEPQIVLDKPGSNVPRPVVGWGPGVAGTYRITRTVAGRVQYAATYTIDDRLLRKVDAGAQGKGVAFLGESFVFGTGIDDKDTLPQRFADDTGREIPVFNLGVAGWSAANVLAELRSDLFDDVFAKTQLNVQFVAPWHAERTGCGSIFGGRGPRFDLVDGKPQAAPPCRRHESALGRFAVYRVFIQPHQRRVDDGDVARLVAITQETIRVSNDKFKIPMIVYYLRDPAYLQKLSWTDDKIIAAFKDAGAQVLDYNLPDGNDPKYKIQGDGHPTPLANRLRAEKLVAFIRANDPKVLEGVGASPH